MASEVGLVGDLLRALWPRIDEAAGRKLADAVLGIQGLPEGWAAKLSGDGFEIRVEADTADEAGEKLLAQVVQQTQGVQQR